MKKDIYEVPAHRYGFAGLMNNIAGNPDENGKLTSGPFAGMSGSVAGGLGALGTAVGGMVGTAIAGGRESAAGNVIDGLSNVASAIPGPWGAVAGAGLKVIGGLTNAAFGVKLNQENINNVNNNIASMNGFQSNAGSFDSLTENFNSQPTMMSFNQDYIGKNGWFNKGATKKFNQLQAQQQTAQQFVNNSLTNNLNNLVMGQNQSLLANYAAKGGPLMTQGTEWNTGLNYIGEGGSHEQNPNGGIQQGIAPDGLPNLVEEGEVVWNGDYVFSKRLKVNKSFKKKYKLGREDKPLSYADAALIFNKEMEERPNDVISKRGRDANLARLAESQEEKRAKIQAKEQQQEALLNTLNAPQEGLSEQDSDIPEEPSMSVEQPVEEQTLPEQYMEQQSAAGMPLESMYSAKGGPIGHRYDLGASLYNNFEYPGRDYLNNDFYEFPLYDESLYSPGYRNMLPTPDEVRQFSVPASMPTTRLSSKALNTGNLKTSNLSSYGLRTNDLNAIGYPTGNLQYAGFTPTPYRKAILGLSDPDYAALLKSINKKPEDFESRDAFITAAEKGKPDALYNGINNWFAKNQIGSLRGRPVVTTPAKLNVATPPLLPSSAGLNTNKSKWSKYREQYSRLFPQQAGTGYPWEGHLRYMPAIGSGLAFFGDLLNLTNRPDYSAADAISRSTRGLRDVRFTPLGDYAKYTPVDRMLALNQLGAAAGANRRALMNQTAGNRGTAMAGLLAADNNFMNNIGTTLFTADNANYDRYMKALAHNAGINKDNSTGFLQADMANQRMDEVRARYNTLAADARMKALQLASANRSANYNNFFDNLGNIGIDALNRADARWLSQYWTGANAPSSRYGYAKCGGKLNKRRRRTII